MNLSQNKKIEQNTQTTHMNQHTQNNEMKHISLNLELNLYLKRPLDSQ